MANAGSHRREDILPAKARYGEVLKSRSRVTNFSSAWASSRCLSSPPPGSDSTIEVILTSPATVSCWKVLCSPSRFASNMKNTRKGFFFPKDCLLPVGYGSVLTAIQFATNLLFPAAVAAKYFHCWEVSSWIVPYVCTSGKVIWRNTEAYFYSQSKNDCGSLSETALLEIWHIYNEWRLLIYINHVFAQINPECKYPCLIACLHFFQSESVVC